ncbi:MAG: archease [Deltaproteobacteria bacterium]
MKKYEFIGHTADVRLKIEADTPQELFQAAIEGMANLMKNGFCRRNVIPSPKANVIPRRSRRISAHIFEEEISISSSDITSLLIDFMAEVLSRSQIEHLIFDRVEFRDFTETSLKAKIFGEKVDQWDKDIKAVTYHEVDIKRDNKGNYWTIVVFDI